MTSEVDLSKTVEPKSDQLNADDLIAGPRTIKVTKVTASDTAEQPVSVHYEGDNGKPWKPCKSMRRVLLALWGSKGSEYVGKRVTLYRDNSVGFGGVQVGGIRISHADIASDMTIALTATRGKRVPTTIKKLPPERNSASSAEVAALSKVLATKGYTESAARLEWVSGQLGRAINAPKDILAEEMAALNKAAEELQTKE